MSVSVYDGRGPFDMAIRTLELSQAQEPLAFYARRVEDETVVLMDEGRVIAALIPFDDFDLENARLAQSPKFRRMLEESAKGGAASEAEAMRELGLAE